MLNITSCNVTTGFQISRTGLLYDIAIYTYILFMCDVCLSVCVHVCMHSCTLWHMCVGRSGTTSVWVSPPRSFETGSAVVHCYGLKASGDSCLCSHLISAALELQMHLLWQQFYLGSEMPKSSPHTCMASISPMEPLPQPQPQLFVCVCMHRTWNTVSLTNYIMNP